MQTDNDADEARDWQGRELSCETCRYRELQAQGKCEFKKACVYDRYVRRIVRFFERNPQLANDHLRDDYFETRAIASKHADVFRLPPMLDDPDETVRWVAASRLPHSYLLKLRNDPHREVRIRIVSRFERFGIGRDDQ